MEPSIYEVRRENPIFSRVSERQVVTDLVPEAMVLTKLISSCLMQEEVYRGVWGSIGRMEDEDGVVYIRIGYQVRWMLEPVNEFELHEEEPDADGNCAAARRLLEAMGWIEGVHRVPERIMGERRSSHSCPVLGFVAISNNFRK